MEKFWSFVRTVNNRWGSEFRTRNDRIFGAIFLATLVFFSILDRIFDWTNYFSFANSDFNFALASGGVQSSEHRGLLVFGFVGIVLCVFECLNALTLLCCCGHTLLGVEIEQTGVLLLEQIPQAIINLAISICRNNFVTSLQAWQCFAGLFNTGLRLYAYGYAKERFFPSDRDGVAATRRVALYINATFLWLFLLFTNIFLWRHSHLGHFQFHTFDSVVDQLDGVSVSLQRDATNTSRTMNATVMYEILNNYHDDKTPWLLRNIADVERSHNHSLDVTYDCSSQPYVLQPIACEGKDVTAIKFRFHYVIDKSKLEVLPAGALYFAYALVGDVTGSCVTQHSLETLKEWSLEFYRFSYHSIPNTDIERLQTDRAWAKVCKLPTPKFDPDLNAC